MSGQPAPGSGSASLIVGASSPVGASSMGRMNARVLTHAFIHHLLTDRSGICPANRSDLLGILLGIKCLSQKATHYSSLCQAKGHTLQLSSESLCLSLISPSWTLFSNKSLSLSLSHTHTHTHLISHPVSLESLLLGKFAAPVAVISILRTLSPAATLECKGLLLLCFCHSRLQ